jgi:hypothetical protein
VLDGNVTMTAVSEICKASGSVHFVSDGWITQPVTIVGQIVT